MSIVKLQDIINKVRRLTGMGTNRQMLDRPLTSAPGTLGITDFINSFYLYDFPAQFRSLKLKDIYTFNTTQGVDVYPFDSEHYTTVEMPCYCMKREIKLFNDRWSFFGVNYNWQQQTNFTYGNGSQGPYSGTLVTLTGGTFNPSGVIVRSVTNNPMTTTIPSATLAAPTGIFPLGYPLPFPQANFSRVQNILITTNTQQGTLNVTDDGNGNLIGDCNLGGTIDYFSGAIANLTFTQIVPQGNAIQAQYNPAQPSVPLSILFFQNQFTLRPVPSMGFTIELTAYRQPSQVLLGSGTTFNESGVPELSEWWEALAFGAAKKIYEDRLDPDGVALMNQSLQEKYALINTRTCAQIGTQRVSTIFADQLTNNYGSGAGFFGGGTL